MKHIGTKVGVVAMVAFLAFGASEALAKRPVTKKEVSGVLNLNTATVQQLDQLPGVGAKAAKRIADYRAKTPFKSPAEVAGIKGFGKKKFEKLKPYLSVTGPTTLVVKSMPATSGGNGNGVTNQGRTAPPKS